VHVLSLDFHRFVRLFAGNQVDAPYVETLIWKEARLTSLESNSEFKSCVYVSQYAASSDVYDGLQQRPTGLFG
jgi:hypothetical protein